MSPRAPPPVSSRGGIANAASSSSAQNTLQPMGHNRTRSRPASMIVSGSATPTFQDIERPTSGLKRRSSTSTKRLSFTEFTKRLSSTSSLLLVQTNASSSTSSGSGNGRTSSELSFGGEPEENTNKGGLRQSNGLAMGLRGGALNDREREAQLKRCGWRGSVGVFGGEGGFL